MFSIKLHYLLMSEMFLNCSSKLSPHVVKLPFFKYLKTRLSRNHSGNLTAVMKVMNSAVELLEKNTYLLENVLFQAPTLKSGSVRGRERKTWAKCAKASQCVCIRVCSSALDHSQIKWCMPVSAGFGKGLKLRI